MNLNINQIRSELIKKKIYNSFMQKWLDDNDMLMYSTHNKGKTNFSKNDS